MPLIFNMDGSKMSKRDKAKAARQALQQLMARDKTLTAAAFAQRTGLDEPLLTAFLAKENDSLQVAERIARDLGIALPEIEVSDFREAGYVPEAIVNFLALLGWNPGMKTADGKDLEKFDMGFIAQNFSIDRIGKTNSKFDRKKLLAFNGDSIAAMSDGEFLRRWLDWLRAYGPPELARRIAEAVESRAPWAADLARAIKPRAKTFRDGVKASEFLLRPDDAGFPDLGANEKHLLAAGASGLGLLRDIRPRLASLADWTPGHINALLESFATEKGLPNVSAVAQPLRIALTGSAVSPPLGETLAILGRDSALRRIDRCLAEVG
jgi:glutamyl-tRNA synthetase